MAEGPKISENPYKLVSDDQNSESDELECPVCLQICVQPTQLPCGHIFCYLCIKGVAHQSRKCALCRREISKDEIMNPKLLKPLEFVDLVDETKLVYDWFYEGRNGWWKYDERTSLEIEQYYQKGVLSPELLICGELYIIDFENKVQYKKYGFGRKRAIKRDLKVAPSLGIAGCRYNDI